MASVSQVFPHSDLRRADARLLRAGKRKFEITLYSSCCNAEKGIYYYTTYENRQITAVSLFEEDLDARGLVRFHC